MWNPDNPRKEKTISLYKQLQEYILDQAASGKRLCDVFEEKGYTRKATSSLARDLYKRNIVQRTKFMTKEGHIYGKNLLMCIEHGIREKLMPPNALVFFKIMIQRGFITNQQLLYEFGFEFHDLYWINKRLIKNRYFNKKNLIKNRFCIYYCAGLNPAEYKKTKEFKTWKKWVDDFSKRNKKEGSWFEDKVEQIYQGAGYQTTRNRWYRTDRGNFEVDIVAWKEDFFGIRTFYISCKKYTHRMLSSNDLMRMLAFRKSLKLEYGEIHLWGWNRISQSIWNNIPAFPFVRVFWKKQFLQLCKEFKITVPEMKPIKKAIAL